MTGWRAKAAGTAVAIALLLAVAAGIAHAMFDGDYIKAIARDRVQAAWSRDLAIDTLSLRLFPVPAVRATGVALSAPSWSQDPILAAADVLEVQLSWRALLSGHVAPGALRLEGGRLMLERAADGRRNWTLDSKGERHGAPDWRQLVRVEAERIDIQYRDGAAAPRRWHIPALSASASPNWQKLVIDGSGVMLERFFSERDRTMPVSGGAMRINASVNGRGASLREMAATLGGSATLRGWARRS